MDFEAALISKILKSPDEILKVLDSRISSDLFVDHSALWDWVICSFRDHGGFPPEEFIKERFPSFQMVEVDSPSSILIDELKKRRVHNLIVEYQTSSTKLLKSKDPYSALEALRECIVRVENEIRSTNDFSFTDDIEDRKKRYAKAQTSGGVTGIPSPWLCFNEATQGFNGGELIMIAGRGGVGKSWAEVLLAWHNWTNNFVPVVISNEMAVWQIIRRLDAVHSQLPYSRFKAGQLTTEEFMRWEQRLNELHNKPKMWILGDEDSMGVTAIAAKIQRYKPDIVYIDGGYLIADDRKAKEGWEKFKNVCWDLKKLALRENIPIVMTHQFNKEGKGLDGNADTLKYGDVQMWFDLIVGVYQDEALKNNKEMLFKINKQREGANIEWVADWDLDAMKFDAKPINDLPWENAVPYDQEAPVDY